MADSRRLKQGLTQRGAVCLIDENNFTYNKNLGKAGTPNIFWKCAQGKCKARIRTTFDLELVGELPVHQHIGNNMLKRKVHATEKAYIKKMALMPGQTVQSVTRKISSTVEVIITL